MVIISGSGKETKKLEWTTNQGEGSGEAAETQRGEEREE